MSNDWDFYRAKVDHEPASIMVDLGIRCEVPKPTHPHMGYLRLYMRNPREDGLSSDDEFEDLCKVGDAIKAEIESTEHIYVGRNTSSGCRDYYFYTSNPKKLETDLVTMMSGFSDYEYETGHREDRQWESYLTFLYPDKNAMQRILNRRVCDALSQNGDDLQIARMIDHWSYFKDKKSMQNFQQFLEGAGFIVKEKGRVRLLSGDYFVNFERMDVPAEIDDTVREITCRIGELGGSYDGWGCSVTNGSPT
jgi:regulator of RNase E activity RraB